MGTGKADLVHPAGLMLLALVGATLLLARCASATYQAAAAVAAPCERGDFAQRLFMPVFRQR
jgi:hypothetical protein